VKYYLAVDLGLVRDRTVLTICHKDKNDNLIYLDYIKTYQGNKNNPVLISDIESDIIWANNNFNIRKNIFDIWQMKSSAQRLQKNGIRVEEFTFTSSTIQKLSQNLYYVFHNGLIRIFPYKPLEDELLSLNAEEKSYGWRIDHKSGGYSDHVISLGMSSMFAIQDERGSAGVLISESPTFEEFEEQLKKEEIAKVNEAGLKKQESINTKQKFPTLRELEELRKRRFIL
jgi:hypothetical protein